MMSRTVWTSWCSLMASFAAIMGINATSAATAQLSGKLGVTLSELSQVTSMYLVAEIVMIPTLGLWLYYFSSVQLLKVASAGFVAASVLCGLATTMDGLLLARILQGGFAGLLMPLPTVVMRDLLSAEENHRTSGAFSLLASLAPLLGPLLSTLVTSSTVGWIFWACGAIAVIGVMGSQGIQGHKSLTRSSTAHVVTLIFFVVGIGVLVWALEHGQLWGWESAAFQWCIGVGASLMLFAVWHQWGQSGALLPFHLCMNAEILVLLSSAFMMGVVIFGLMYLIPYAMVQIHQYDPFSLYIVILYAAVPQCVFIPFAVALRKKVAAAPLIMAGCAIAAFSAYQMSTMGIDFAGEEMMLPQLMRAIAIPLIVLPIGYLLLNASGPSQPTSMMFSLFRTLGGALGVAGMTAYVNVRQSSHAQSQSAYGTPTGDQAENVSWLYAFNDMFGWLSVALMVLSAVYAIWFIHSWQKTVHENKQSR